MARVETMEALESLYCAIGDASTAKVARMVTPEYRAMTEAAPFAALATVGLEGQDCSPRGDLPGFVRVHDSQTLMLPDRRGNNRIDSLRNIIRDPRVALMFLIPGCGNALRVNGRAWLDDDEALLQSFAVEGKAPRSVMVMQVEEVEEVYFQCARAIIRACLWGPARHVDPRSLPTPGQILSRMTAGSVGGETYDREWAGRAAATMW